MLKPRDMRTVAVAAEQICQRQRVFIACAAQPRRGGQSPERLVSGPLSAMAFRLLAFLDAFKLAPGEPLPYAAGDRIRFAPIDEGEFERIQKREEAKRHGA